MSPTEMVLLGSGLLILIGYATATWGVRTKVDNNSSGGGIAPAIVAAAPAPAIELQVNPQQQQQAPPTPSCTSPILSTSLVDSGTALTALCLALVCAPILLVAARNRSSDLGPQSLVLIFASSAAAGLFPACIYARKRHLRQVLWREAAGSPLAQGIKRCCCCSGA